MNLQKLSKIGLALALLPLASNLAYAGSVKPNYAKEPTQLLVGLTQGIESGLESQQVASLSRELTILINEFQTMEQEFKKLKNLTKKEDWFRLVDNMLKLKEKYGQVEGTITNISDMDRVFDAQYPGYNERFNKGGATFSQQAVALSKSSDEYSKRAMASAGIFINDSTNNTQVIEQLLAKSESAEGRNQIIQSGNAILGNMVTTLQKVRQMQASMGLAQQAEMDRQVQKEMVEKVENNEELYKRQQAEKSAAQKRIEQIRGL